MEGESIVAFTDGSALGNPGPTGAGAAIYMNGLNSHAERLKKGICKNGNNYLGEIIGLEITLKYLAEEAEVSNRSIHIFTDCQSAIESVFGNGMPSYKVDTVLNIRRISSYLKDRGNSVVVHWIPGHKGFVGNELADSLAKEAAKEMIDSQEEFYEGEADKKEIMLMKGSIVDKWQRMYENS